MLHPRVRTGHCCLGHTCGHAQCLLFITIIETHFLFAAAGIAECHVHLLKDSDIAGLSPNIGTQLAIRDIRDQKQVSELKKM